MLKLDEARRIAVAAQGFCVPRPGQVRPLQLEQTVRRIAPLQLDFVNVLVPAHYLIPFSRLGPYKREMLHSLLYEHGGFTEQWAHEASAIPVETWPLLKHRMAEHVQRPDGFDAQLERHREYVEKALTAIREQGPLAAHQLPEPPAETESFSATWIGTFQRAVLEAHFGRGVLASANRLGNFARSYDLAERRIPAEHFHRTPSREEAVKELLLRAGRAHGIGTAHDLGDYYRLGIAEARRGLAELAGEGALEEVRVEGWDEPAYLHPEAERPRGVRGCAFLSPFDPLVWFRPRVERLFGFDYRIEIYTPAEKRKYGYYVLPFLQNGRLTGRADLKADRSAGVLRVMASYHEEGQDRDAVAKAMFAELVVMAGWLGLRNIVPEKRGNLASRLYTF